jgi:hypothetical protein
MERLAQCIANGALKVTTGDEAVSLVPVFRRAR